MNDKDTLLKLTKSYLAGLILKLSDISIEDKDQSTPFQELGIDSFRVLQIIKKLEEEFGTLSKTLLFENFNLVDLSGYFVNKHEKILLSKFEKNGLSGGASLHAEAVRDVDGIKETAGPGIADRPTSTHHSPIIISVDKLVENEELQLLVNNISEQYKNEGTVSRGTNCIAPDLFIGRERKGYFNCSRFKKILLVYTFTGPGDYFLTIASEMLQYCVEHDLELNIFSSEQIDSINDTPFTSTPFGVMSRIINLKDFSLEGGKMRRLRYQVAKFENAGRCRTEEYKNGDDEKIDCDIAHMIDRWSASRTMVNPLIYIVKDEIVAGNLPRGHRLFLTYLDDVLQNVILISKLSPEENGYLMDLEFYPPEMRLGGLEYAIVKIIGILAGEGCDMLSLGGTYGCKLDDPIPAKADPELESTLNYLREQHIFNDEGNLQFKNKFRPEHDTVFLCRPAFNSNPDNIIDVIMMIADPVKMRTPIEENTSSEKSSDKPLKAKQVESPAMKDADRQPEIGEDFVREGDQRSVLLAEAGYNVLNIPDHRVDFDMKTDSWSQLNLETIRLQREFLYARIQQAVDVQEVLKTIFPFSHFALTVSGSTAEHAFFKAWGRKGEIIQNPLFPTTIFNQIDNGFVPVELSNREIFTINSHAQFTGDLDLQALQERIEKDALSIALVLMEVADNAVGGGFVSIAHLKQVKSLLSAYAIPLFIDGTRIMENAQYIIEHEKGYSGKNIWEVVKEISSCVDGIIASLTKDFCIEKGGMIATNDASLHKEISDVILQEGIGLDPIERKLLALSFQNKEKIARLVLQRMASVRYAYDELTRQKAPLFQHAGGHCLLIDVDKIPEFACCKFPVHSFLSCLFLNTGIRASAHSAGLMKNTVFNRCVRLAIPVGLEKEEVEKITKKLVTFFGMIVNIPEIIPVDTPVRQALDIHERFKLEKYHNTTRTIFVRDVVGASRGGNSDQAQSEVVASALEKDVCERPQTKEIAIVGVAGRYPKSKNLTELWENLSQGRDCVELISDVRFNQRSRNQFSEKYRGGFIDNIDKFDSLFFNISPKEAAYLDPQERLFLEVAWEVLEDAGYYPERLAEKDPSRKTGVFVGAVWTLYQMLGVEEKFKGNNLNPSSHLWAIANRVSYTFDFSGPSLTVDTACSSSLYAVYLACEAIRKGECHNAIVGGVNLDIHQSKIDINNGGGALSKDGVCRTFGKNANGYVAGEGVGAIFIKPLEQAVKDGDHIYGVIKSVAINHGGKTGGFMVPSPQSQAKVITSALEDARIDARSIGYVEAHGTGTELGDPIEIAGLSMAFQRDKVDHQSCPVGSIKTNIGHLEAAAGIVGIHKVLLQMKHEKIVPSLHSSELNPFIDFGSSPFYVEQVLEDWKPKTIDGITYPLRAGISSFGAGGANAHLIVEKYDAEQEVPSADRPTPKSRLFFLSTKNENLLREAADRLLVFLQKELHRDEALQSSLDDIAYTLRVGRKSFEYRLVILAKTKQELVDKLSAYIEYKKDDNIITGKVKSNDGIARLLSPNEKDEFVKLIYSSGDLYKLAHLWVEGLISGWHDDAVLEKGKIISLPTYPFADKRHWISDLSQKESNPTLQNHVSIHPFIDSNESTFDRQIFKKIFHDKDFFMYDHLVSGIPTLPGVAYLDMARKAGEMATGWKVSKLKNVLLLSPIAIENATPLEVFIELIPKGDFVQFDVFSKKDNDQVQLHAQGRLYYAAEKESTIQPSSIDLQSIISRSEKIIEGGDVYPVFELLGLSLGPSFQVLREVFKSKDEILGLLEIPKERVIDFNDFLLHPALLDGSGQTGMAVKLVENLNGNSGEIFVPYSFGEIEIFHPLPKKCYAYIKNTKDTAAKITKTNVLILDENGQILISIKDSVGVPLVNIHNNAGQNADAPRFSRLYYRPVWEKSLLGENHKLPVPSGSILLFVDDDAFCENFKLHVKKTFPAISDVVVVRSGRNYQSLSKQAYTVNPHDPLSFNLLLRDLGSKKISVEKICYAWSLRWGSREKSELTGKNLQKYLEKGVYPFLSLCQALVSYPYNEADILYLYSSGLEVQPDNDAMAGFVKTIRLEYPKFNCRVLDIQQEKPLFDSFWDILQAELYGGDKEDVVRYIGRERYTRKLQELKLEEATVSPNQNEIKLKERGVYLITGGVGGLGLIFAELLAQQCGARLMLVGRSGLTGEKESKLAELRKMGCEVNYHRADISKSEEVDALITATKSLYGEINGIIHSAGVIRDAYLANKSKEELKDVFAPKLYGTVHLDNATKADDLDFFVLFSSMAALSGNVGQCDYAYANNFMDSFAHWREALRIKGERQGKTLSFNWSIWADGGMKLDEQTEIFFKKNLGIQPITQETGCVSFLRGLAIKENQIAVLEGIQDKIEKAWGLRETAGRKDPEDPVSNAIVGNELTQLIEKDLSELVMELLRIDEEDISADKILLDLGFDSIGMASFANMVNEKYGLDDITPVLFFEYPSIGAIAGFLCNEHAGKITKVHQMSNESSVDKKSGDNVEILHSKDVLNNSPVIGKRLNFRLPDLEANNQNNNSLTSFEHRFSDMPIAIVGMSGIMPQADDLNEYWEKLKNAENNMVTLVPPDRWRWEDYYGDPLEEKNKTKIKWGGFMREVDKFDPQFWGISPREASSMDPQQRIFLEIVWKAIEDSGHKVSELSGTKTGIFVGVGTRDYIDLMNQTNAEISGYSASGTSHAVLANRVSFMLNLHGPSAPLDTACSSSLVALHRAVESIHTGSSDMAIVAGVQVMLTPAGHIGFGAAGMLADDGKCKTFDERANGYVRGEGAGAIVIKPLSMAKADGDHIYAIIKSTAENHGGKVTMLTAPNPNAQAELLIEAYEKAGIDPTTVGYMECHGTGTKVGDPIEIQSMKKAFSTLYKKHNKTLGIKPHIGLTSAKSNIGHLETAAGIAGVLKVLLSIQYKQIPALLHFQKLNPYIKLEDTPFYIVEKTKFWDQIKDDNGMVLPRRAGVSSFGFGGANVHVVLEEYIPDSSPAPDYLFPGFYLIVLSAKKEERLREYAQIMLDYLNKQEVELVDFAYTLQVGRDAMAERIGLVAASLDELMKSLQAFVDGMPHTAGFYQGKVHEKNKLAVDEPLIDKWIDQKQITKIMEAWVGGYDMDWGKLYGNIKPKRLSLPSYPFAKERYWFKTLDENQAARAGLTVSALHPLVQSNTSDLSRQSYSSVFHGQEAFIKDYAYTGGTLLPVSAYFEMIHAAVGFAVPVSQQSNCLGIKDMVCKGPISLDKKQETTIILFVNEFEQVEFEICGDSDGRVHCAGQAVYFEDLEPEKIPLRNLLDRMPRNEIPSDGLYAYFATKGLKYGDFYRSVKAVHQENNQLLVQLSLPRTFSETQNRYRLHPGLIDGVMQAFFYSFPDYCWQDAKEVAFFDFTMDSCMICSALKEEMYAWIRFSDNNCENEMKLDVDLCDVQGNACVQINGLLMGTPYARNECEVVESAAGQDLLGTSGIAKPSDLRLISLEEIHRPAEKSKIPATDTSWMLEEVFVDKDGKGKKFPRNREDVYSEAQLKEQLIESLAKALYINQQDIDVDRSFIDLGLDSIVGVEWLSVINKQYGIELPASIVYDYPNIRKLAVYLHEEIEKSFLVNPAE